MKKKQFHKREPILASPEFWAAETSKSSPDSGSASSPLHTRRHMKALFAG